MTFALGMTVLIITSLNAEYMEGEQIMMLNDKMYDFLKWIAIVAFPALSTFIVVLGKIWGWGDIANMIGQSITAFAVLLGALLGISSIQYKKGDNNGNG
jgi:hypothetical protein